MGRPGLLTWAFWNSQLVTTIIGALILSLVVAWVSHRWQMRTKLFEFQVETFRSFNDVSGEVIIRLTDLYHLRDTVPDVDFQKIRREVAHRKLALLNMDAQIEAAFRDESLFGDLLEVKSVLNEIQQEILQTPTKGPLGKIEPLQNRYIWQTKVMKMKMMRKMEMMTRDKYNQGIRRLQELIRQGMSEVK